MAWASTSKVLMGGIAFIVWWVFSVFPEVPLLPIGTTAGSLLGATLMVLFQVISPNKAFAAVDLPVLGFRLGTMVQSVYLEKADLSRYLKYALTWETRGGMDLLCRVCLLASLSSALFTNDNTCFVLTPIVLEICRSKKLNPESFLIALACSSNIGSAATPFGNPQNVLIAVKSGISFGRFLAAVLPAVAIGLMVLTLLLLVVYGRSLSLDSTSCQHTTLPVAEDSEISRREGALQNGRVIVSLVRAPPQKSGNVSDHDGESEISSFGLEPGAHCEIDVEPESSPGSVRLVSWRKHQQTLRKASVYLVTLGMLVALLAGLSLPGTAITAAVAMMILDFSDAGPSLAKVPYSLLVFFAGMCIATSGLNATGAPEEFWSAVELHSRIDTARGVSVLSLVVIALSNVLSNVPTVMLLGERVAASAAGTPGASSDKAWLILAWVSTVAGNLTLGGSAANIIVRDQARPSPVNRERQMDSQCPPRTTYNLTFWNHLKFGFPSTLIVIAVGLLPIVLKKF